MNDFESMQGGREDKKDLPIIDVSDKFLNLRPIEFLEHLRQFRKKEVRLSIAIPWTGGGDSFLAAKALKDFVDGASPGQEREANFIGSEKQFEEARKNAPNAFDSKVGWEFPESEDE